MKDAHPPAPQTVEALEEALSAPPERLVQSFSKIPGDLLLLGVGGKMGPTLARMARRASDAAGVSRRVIGVSRFSSPATRDHLERHGVETIAGDLLDEDFLASLPNVENVVMMTGYKFGAGSNPSLTWAMNCFVPAQTVKRFRESRIVAFSSGNIYGNVPVDSGGSRETDTPRPVGEYAMTVLGRERLWEHFSRTLSIPMAILRLNYAVELRYGVLVDLAQQIHRGEPVDVTMGAVNVIWQQEANAMALEAFSHVASPPLVVNLAGPEMLRTREVCQTLGELLGKPVQFQGTEAPDALLNDGRRGHELLGRPTVRVEQMLRWIADWVGRGGPTLNKPTHFQVRDGNF